MVTQTDQILDFILRFPGRDDDEIARLLKISQRQTVNIVCRKLAERGRIRRAKGPSGNSLTTLLRLILAVRKAA